MCWRSGFRSVSRPIPRNQLEHSAWPELPDSEAIPLSESEIDFGRNLSDSGAESTHCPTGIPDFPAAAIILSAWEFRWDTMSFTHSKSPGLSTKRIGMSGRTSAADIAGIGAETGAPEGVTPAIPNCGFREAETGGGVGRKRSAPTSMSV